MIAMKNYSFLLGLSLNLGRGGRVLGAGSIVAQLWNLREQETEKDKVA